MKKQELNQILKEKVSDADLLVSVLELINQLEPDESDNKQTEPEIDYRKKFEEMQQKYIDTFCSGSVTKPVQEEKPKQEKFEIFKQL